VKPALWLPFASVVTSNWADAEVGAVVGVAVADGAVVVGVPSEPLLLPPPHAASVSANTDPASKAARCILKRASNEVLRLAAYRLVLKKV